jgi:hypothetical protein
MRGADRRNRSKNKQRSLEQELGSGRGEGSPGGYRGVLRGKGDEGK